MMNRIILTISLIATIGFARAQYTAIPDLYFEQDLINKGIDSEGVLDGQVLTSDINIVITLGFLSYEIQDLTGIEGFIALEHLDCGNIQIQSLDLSQNTNLEYLDCGSCPLTSLNVTECVELKVLNCKLNNLSLLDVNNNALLEELICWSNNITSLNVSNNPNLWFLQCADNQLSNLDVSANPDLLGLKFGGNEINNIDISQNINLLSVGCYDNFLTNLDVSQNAELVAIDVSNNQLTGIDVSQNPNLERLRCYNNSIEGIDVSQNPVLEVLNCQDNELTALNVQNGANHLLTGTYTINNQTYIRFNTTDNSNLICIFVDDAVYSTENWLEIDPASTFVETQAACDALYVNSFVESDEIQVFPNPVKEVFYIQTKIPIKRVLLYNSLGVLVKSFVQQDSYSLKGFKKGVYFVCIEQEKGFIVRKLVVE